MSKKRKIGKILLILAIIAIANIYFGCIETNPKASAEEQIRLKQLETNQELLMQQRSKEQQAELDVIKKELEELMKKWNNG